MKGTTEKFLCTSNENDLTVLKNVLKLRLPKSAHEYNMLLSKQWFPEEVNVYTLDGDLSAAAIVVLIILRKDYGQDINISVPLTFMPTEYVREALINTKIIDWDEAYFFTSVNCVISPLIFEISTKVKKNSVLYNPNYQFAFDVEEALQFDFKLDVNIELRPLEVVNGSKFLLDNWKYTRNGSIDHVQTVLKKNPSVGIFVDGNLACGALVNVHGLLGLLYTGANYRRHGFAQMCARYLSKEMAKLGMVPCSSSQSKNVKSVNFHEKLGMKITHETAYILHTPYTEERTA